MKDWVANMDPEQRETVINGVYEALASTNADTVHDLGKLATLKAVMGMDDGTRRQAASAMRILYQSLRRSLPERPLKMLEDRLGILTGKGEDKPDPDE